MSQGKGLTSEQTLALILPPSVSHGTGGHLVDMQGNVYVDMISAWGTNLLGYGHPRIAEAISRQARRYTNLGLAGPEYTQLHGLLTKHVPSSEAMHLVKNGSDACAVAARLARHLTGRDLILHRGYHGAQDWYMASLRVPGVPASHYSEIAALPDLNPGAVAEALGRAKGRVAAIMIDPMVAPIPDAATMREVARLARAAGALLVFDEVVSGFRVAVGGMQERWGVLPDLTCLGKGMANGMPLAALVGPQRHMDRIAEINYSLTYGLEACSIAAACATIAEVVETDVPGRLARMGQHLKTSVDELAQRHDLPVALVGPDVRPSLHVGTLQGIAGGVGSFKLVQSLARNRVSTYGTFSLCAAHTPDDLDAVIAALQPALSDLADTRAADAAVALAS